jgi:hypothetical protein
MSQWTVYLYSRGDRIAHGRISACYEIQASDDVEAAMSAKEEARKQFPDRDAKTWFADRVELAKIRKTV